MTAATDPARVICSLAEMRGTQSRAFSAGTGDWPLRGFVVRQGDRIFAYLNRCPHAGHPLNMRAHEFLDRDGATILCNSHGAQFDIATGRCLTGPCVGASLRAIAVEVIDGVITLIDDPDELARRYG
jgi:nitrite reductase/ring-hydroxylating ferredoxin subunit